MKKLILQYFCTLSCLANFSAVVLFDDLLIPDNNGVFDVVISTLSICFTRFAHYSNVIPSTLCGYTYVLSWPLLSFFCVLFSQMLSVSQAAGSPAVSLVYTVRNGTAFLNGTTASNLLGQLSAELVGYFLFYPPLIIAERKLQFALTNTSVCQK